MAPTFGKKPIGIGLIGCGMIGQGHAYALRLLAEDGEVRPVAVTDLSEDAVRAAQRICPFESIGTDAQAVIDDPDVDAVVIVTPTTTHRDLVRATLAAGKPLLCEKPLATDFDDVREMCALVAGAGTHRAGRVPLSLPSADQRAAIRRARRRARTPDGLHRCATTSTGRRATSCPGTARGVRDRARAGGGALLEHSIHSADILTWLFGPAARVYARTRNVFGYDVEDTAVCTIEHESGVVGTLISIFNGVRGREERRLEVFFEHGAVEVTTDFLVGAPEDSFLIQRPDAPPERLDMVELREQHFAAAGIERRDFFIYLYPAARAFVAAARTGQAASPGFGDALRARRARRSRVPLGRLGSARRLDRRPRRRFVVDLTEVDDVFQVEDAVQHREHRRIEVRCGSEMRVHVERTVTRVLAQAHQRAHTGRIHELDAIEIEHDLVRVGRQAREHARADDARGEHVEHPRNGRGSDSERVDDDDLSGGVCHAPVLPRFRGDGNPHVRRTQRGRDTTIVGPPLSGAAFGRWSSPQRLRRGREAAERVGQDAAGEEHLALERRVDPARSFELVPSAVTRTSTRQRAVLGERLRAPTIAEDLVAGEPERRDRLAVRELERQHAHPDEVRPVDALEALDEHRPHAEQLRALRGPVARRTRAVLLAGEHDERHALRLRTASPRRRSSSARRREGAP